MVDDYKYLVTLHIRVHASCAIGTNVPKRQSKLLTVLHRHKRRTHELKAGQGAGQLTGIMRCECVLRFRRSVRIEGNKAPIYLGGGAIAGISKPRNHICLPASDFHTALAA